MNDLVANMADDRWPIGRWELYFGAFFKFLIISGRVATVVEIYQFVSYLSISKSLYYKPHRMHI